MAAYSGTPADFVPSVFVTYDRAMAQGRAALAAGNKSVAEVAAENKTVSRMKARFALVQDGSGKAVISRQ
jgi:hypothetical protein